MSGDGTWLNFQEFAYGAPGTGSTDLYLQLHTFNSASFANRSLFHNGLSQD